ncbi:redoxin domain-containing protein [Bacillus sp. PS06]|nr:redoxin domain-containing protein [Bacillus sp. PS06]
MVQLHQNLDELDGMDVNMYILSNDLPEQQLELYQALEQEFGKSVDFVSDTNLEVADLFGMKNGEVAYRGYGMLDTEGNVVFKTVNDHWGEEFDQSIEEIKEEYDKLTN